MSDVLWSGCGRRETKEGSAVWGKLRLSRVDRDSKVYLWVRLEGKTRWYSAITVKRKRRSCCCREWKGRGLSRRGTPVGDRAPTPTCGQETGKRPWGRRSPGESSRSGPARWAAAAWRGEPPESASGSPAAGSGIGRCCRGNGGGGSSRGKMWGACWRTAAGN